MSLTLLKRFVLCALLLLFAASCGDSKPARLPDVIVITIDTLRADRLSQDGYALPTSPGLDRLANSSTYFTRAYAPSSWTKPSTASILTGLAPDRVQMGKFVVLDPSIQTLAEELQAAGWHTVGRSFNVNISAQSGFDQGFDIFSRFVGSPIGTPDIRQMLAGALSAFEQSGDRPLFLYLQPMNVHGPYRVPQDKQSILLGRAPRPNYPLFRRLQSAIMRGRTHEREQVTSALVARLNEAYDTAVRYTTDQLGAFFDELDARGRYDGALIVVTSDHGEELFDHAGFNHGYTLYDEVLRVPLFVKLPYQRRGRQVSHRVALMDIQPTLLDALGLEQQGPVDGRSLLTMLEDDVSGVDSEPRVLIHSVNWEKRAVAHAISSGGYKLIEIESNYEGLEREKQLYDLNADPHERHDLAEQLPEVVAELGLEMRRRVERYRAGAVHAEKFTPSEADLEQLRALGYVD